MKIKRILIANRGEIALRIIKTCKSLNISTVVVYAKDDKNRLVENACDRYISLTGSTIHHTYMNQKKIIKVAKKESCDAIHPGYGFLAEDPRFAELCEKSGLVFIGPSSTSLAIAGDKLTCRAAAADTGIPIIPASSLIHNHTQLGHFASQEGYPLILKSIHAGGGRGMRLINNFSDLKPALISSVEEISESFASSQIFAEKFVKGRHIEIQFLVDTHGTCVCLPERECSVQRRFQKLIEETPSPAVDSTIRRKLFDLVRRIAVSVEYSGAGTVEFIMTPNKRLYFLEINPRIQVEHGISEAITGMDLVKEQILIAEGKRVASPSWKGHAIECRIVAENVRDDFSPTYGRIDKISLPDIPGVRVDTAVHPDLKIHHKYDSLLMKIISYASTRQAALNRMHKALENTIISGVQNNIEFSKLLIRDKGFSKGNISTSFVTDRNLVKKYTDDTLNIENIANIVLLIFQYEKKNEISCKNSWSRRLPPD
ncbi:acetyl/propionyl/methylcrotonyl-CoA carboxylase subunit alpha [Nanoarchaeota archaeon]